MMASSFLFVISSYVVEQNIYSLDIKLDLPCKPKGSETTWKFKMILDRVCWIENICHEGKGNLFACSYHCAETCDYFQFLCSRAFSDVINWYYTLKLSMKLKLNAEHLYIALKRQLHEVQCTAQCSYTLIAARFPRILRRGNVSDHHTSRSGWLIYRTECNFRVQVKLATALF